MPSWAGLSPAQCIALQALLKGKSYTEAAKQAGVARRTLYNWRSSDETFAAALDNELEAGWEEHRERMESLRGRALDVLEKAMDTTLVGDVALRAAITTLDRAGLPVTKEVRHSGNSGAGRDPDLANLSKEQLRQRLSELEAG